MGRRSKPTNEPGANVTPFPPLPRVPEPPILPSDPRQRAARQITGAISGLVEREAHVVGPNFSTGFHASAVDLGRLQDAIAEGIDRLDASQLEERWDEVRKWIWSILRTWIQRCKSATIERCGDGVRVRIETQDDRGYYEYVLEVVSRRR